jgi:hypothetical protein
MPRRSRRSRKYRGGRRVNDPMPLGFNEENLEIPMNANNQHFVNVPENENNLNETIEDPSIVELNTTNASQRRRRNRKSRRSRRKSRRT